MVTVVSGTSYASVDDRDGHIRATLHCRYDHYPAGAVSMRHWMRVTAPTSVRTKTAAIIAKITFFIRFSDIIV